MSSLFFISVDPNPLERKAARHLIEALEEANIVTNVHTNLS
jgi:hypothetical protein